MKVTPGALQPDTVPAVHRGFYARGGPRGLVIQSRPQPGRRKWSEAELEYQRRFAFAARMASSPFWADLGTAIEMTKGEEQVPRDLLTAVALGGFYEFVGPDGQGPWGHVVGATDPWPYGPGGGPDVWGTVWGVGVSGHENGWSGYTLVNEFKIAALTVPVNTVTKVRLTLRSSSSGWADTDNIWFGPQASTGDVIDFEDLSAETPPDPVQILNAGSPSFLFTTQNEEILSDEIDFQWDGTSNLLSSIHPITGLGSGLPLSVTDATKYDSWYKNGVDEAGLIDKNGATYSGWRDRIYMVTKIEMTGF